jgi:carboxyvinyl-carboxyphosphonate phosphorylmutase
MTTRWTPRREAFRALLAAEQCIHPGSVFDPISARIAQDLGFEMGMFAGSVASMTVLGAPDLITLTLSEFADQAQRICRAGELPLLVDADHGYGNALNVMRTVEELENAGVAALSIEDTDLPQGYGTQGKGRLISMEEAEGKLRAAVAARCDPNLCIAGRSHAGLASIDELQQRVKRYQQTGVDAIFVVGVKTQAQLDALSEVVSLPLILGAIPAELMDKTALARRGVRICLQGHQPFQAAVQGVYATLKALRDGVPTQQLQGIASGDLMQQVTRGDDYRRWREDFL